MGTESMTSFQRGDIYWVDLNPTQGSEINKIRPCIVIGANSINKARKTIIVIPISTSSKAYPPLTIPVFLQDTTSVAVIDQIRSVDKKRFRERIGKLPSTELSAVEDGLRQILGLSL